MPYNTARSLCLLALVGAFSLLGGPASSRQVQPSQETTLGILTCGLGRADAGPAQTRDILCQFRFGRAGSYETYTGTVRSVGRTEDLYGKGAIMLAVKGPASTEMVPGLLEQAYSAEGSAVSAAAPLVGQANGTLLLQPLIEEVGRVAAGKARPDVTIVAVELKLKASPA